MLKKLVVFAGSLALASTATAAPLTLSVGNGGGWSNPVAGAGVCTDVDNFSGSAQDEIRWGAGFLTDDAGRMASAPAGYEYLTTGGDACWSQIPEIQYDSFAAISGYNFNPFDGQYQHPGGTALLNLGTFQHLNNNVSAAITGVDYTFNLEHNGQNVGSPLGLTMNFAHNETDNLCGLPGAPCSDDIVTMTIPVLSTLFQVGNDTFLFELLGFSPTGEAGSFNSQFVSPEGGTRSTALWAQITQQNPVPEPATLTMLGTGLLGLGAAARRRMRKNRAA